MFCFSWIKSISKQPEQVAVSTHAQDITQTIIQETQLSPNSEAASQEKASKDAAKEIVEVSVDASEVAVDDFAVSVDTVKPEKIVVFFDIDETLWFLDYGRHITEEHIAHYSSLTHVLKNGFRFPYGYASFDVYIIYQQKYTELFLYLQNNNIQIGFLTRGKYEKNHTLDFINRVFELHARPLIPENTLFFNRNDLEVFPSKKLFIDSLVVRNVYQAHDHIFLIDNNLFAESRGLNTSWALNVYLIDANGFNPGDGPISFDIPFSDKYFEEIKTILEPLIEELNHPQEKKHGLNVISL